MYTHIKETSNLLSCLPTEIRTEIEKKAVKYPENDFLEFIMIVLECLIKLPFRKGDQKEYRNSFCLTYETTCLDDEERFDLLEAVFCYFEDQVDNHQEHCGELAANILVKMMSSTQTEDDLVSASQRQVFNFKFPLKD